MANKIVLKNNRISGTMPSPDELVLGEIAINTADGILYAKTNSGVVTAVGLSEGSSSLVSSVAGRIGNVVLNKNDVGLSNVDNTSDTNKPVSTAQAAANTQILNAAETLVVEKSENAKLYAIERSNHTGTQEISTVSGLQTALNNKANTTHNHDDRYYTESEVNTLLATKQASGNYATLVNGVVPSTQLPSYVDDVVEVESLATLPVSGETGKIYVTLDNNKTYRWGGSSYVEISASPGSTDAVPEGSVNLYYTDSRAALAAPVQSVAGRAGHIDLSKSDVGLINVDNTSDINKPISNAVQFALDTKASSNHDHSLPNENTKIGRLALIGNTSGYRNTSVGCDSMQSNTNGYNNTAVGSPALWQNISGFNNTAIGAWSLIFNTSGIENTAIGSGSLTNNVTGNRNINIGAMSGFNNTTGIQNTIIGTFSGLALTTGSNNTILGFSANVSENNTNNCIVLGANAVANKSGEFVLGSDSNPINTSSSVGDQGSALPLPARPLGYLEVRLNNQLVKIPYYN